jgi:hypothetical protein
MYFFCALVRSKVGQNDDARGPSLQRDGKMGKVTKSYVSEDHHGCGHNRGSLLSLEPRSPVASHRLSIAEFSPRISLPA